MGQRISAERFYQAFVDEWETAVAAEAFTEKGDNPFQDLSAWTDFMLERGGFLERVMGRVASVTLPLQYRTE